ncbi:unnamed protein product [Microthlaspi erraticum]|uniref:Uncharacterized protein n=1 Tax=Microthlaspi erraticum TaxID=1685480 RepID=A0A6D2JSS8_9BRAS|nr:unnamed protein product [Microthlaspi erraticum]
MMLKSVFSKYARARARAVAGARTERNFSSRRSESQGRRFSSSISHSPQDISLGKPTLFAVTVFGGTFVYMITDIVMYNVHNRRLKTIREEYKNLRDISKKVSEKLFAEGNRQRVGNIQEN